MRRKKNKIKYFSTQASHISIFSKVVIVILIIGMIMGHLHLGAITKALEPEVYTTIADDVERDFSEFDKIEEINSLRTSNSKTYLKENGMYETEYYGEKIHYKDKDEWKEIDNSLSLKDNNRYHNNSNKYNISFPNKLNKNNEVVLNYLNNEIKIYYDIEKDINAKLSDKIDRTKKNTKDEISYNLSSQEIIQYIIKQDSIKENIILKSYIENYNYSYYIDTDLRIERIGDELYFYDGQTEVFVMNEYYMYDAENNTSKDIDFEINVIDENTYKVEVTPSNEYLKDATYPVVIDPEITLTDGGILDGVTWLLSVDKQANTAQHLDIGSFSLANRSNSTTNDDKVAYLELYIPREYDKNIGDIITQNQLMYANLILTTVSSTNVSVGSKVDLKYATSFNWPVEGEPPTYNTEYVDSQYFHGSTVFNHKFDILEGITSRLEDFKTEDICLGFELSLDANANAEVAYSLGWDLGGDKPLITLGYVADAGLADYYTYESLPISNDSDVYISHNSGNLTFIYNDYNDGNLLNLSHIYNANRKHNNSQYGNGFSINYNERISTFFYNSRLLLTEGDGREIIFYTQNDEDTQYLAGDGSGDVLYRLVDETNATTGYKVETSDGSLKIYDIEGKLTTIYMDKDQYENPPTDEGVVIQRINISYNTDGTLSRVDDSYGNYMLFNYLTSANNPTEDQEGISYLAFINVYKYIPEEDDVEQAEYIEFIYDKGNLQNIGKYGTTTDNCIYTYFTYNEDNHLKQISKNGRGYTFEYDIKNRITMSKVYSTDFTNGDYLTFEYDSNGKKTKITNGSGDSTSYTFDDYYHTNSIETSSGYTTFYKYQDIYYDSEGTLITSPNYNMNHKVILQSNSFKNVGNPINNHGFEIIESGSISGWKTELTNNSTASIDTSIYLYGSKVLELKKTSSGTAKVYQEISVEEGQTYIVSGYIHNKNNTGNGAYIEVVGTDGTITYQSSSNNVKNTTNFVRFEYKFIANFSGKAKVYLVNSSTGKAYFDNIQVNTNYVDTRYNYLENSSFEVDTLADFYNNNEIYGWEFYNGCELIDVNFYDDTSLDVFNENCGSKYVKLFNNNSIYQIIHTPGLKDDIFVFGGYCFYENYTGNVTVSFKFITENGENEKVFVFDENDINATYMMNKFKAPEDYIAISIEIKNNSETSYAVVDNFAIYKEGYGINLTYNDDGYVTEENNEITGSTTGYEYDNDGNIIQIATDNDQTSLEYENGYLNTIENQNIVTTINTNENGNIEDITAVGKSENGDEEEIGYFYGSTDDTDDGLYPKTETDVFGKVTTYTYDYLTGLVTSVVDPNGVSTEYTYDKDGNVIQLVNGQGTNKKTIIYTYDEFGNILTITNGDLVYTFTYNDYGDLKTISVGDSLLLTNNYKNENNSSDVYTGELVESVYSYGTISIEYNENHQISKIYNGTGSSKYVVLEYTYNDYGEIASYTDYKENVTYYYNYDYENKLINVNATNGNNISYTYDTNSNLIGKHNINGDNNYTYTDLNPDEDVEDNKLTGESISGKFAIDYEYTNDSYRQLEVISYYITTLPIESKYTYETTVNPNDNKTYYTGRIKELEYTNGSNQIIKYVYEYDDHSNISKIYGYTNGVEVYYEENYYDIFNQLTAQWVEIEDDSYMNEYGYDSRGNVIGYYSQGPNVSYSGEFWYDDNDQIVEATINGISYDITYSSTGQPSIYLGWEIDYDMRNICVIENDDYYIEYYYNANGIRIGKSIDNGDEIESVNYILDGSNIIKEIHTGANNYTIEYYYDSSDNIIGFTYNGSKYLYLKNLQNDVIGIVDSNNNIVVKYYYDAYGRIIKTLDTSGINLSTINPFRYRSYYQDNETGWYYLNSRYYNPLTNRFVTMDQIEYLGASENILSYNLYSYCENDPINKVDYNGNSAAAIYVTSSVFTTFCGWLGTIGGANWWNPVGWIIAAVIALGVITYAAVSLYNSWQNTISQADSKVKSKVTKNSKTRYWSANLKWGYVDIGKALTYKQAVKYVIQGKNIFTVTSGEAYAVAIAAGGTPKSVINEIDKGKQNTKGYYWHYHVNRQNKAHIWYLF